ncbi:helix-turn-helix domain-containing protein [Methylicorpusculum oleiharenae]|uniref:helix-turn-helix domain-containing protein n=1 Tax=Methylicorpusculum oleiharenae TaxID=1338687 RepID=UPI001356DB38|nr:helix-turn-helix domain-containing protein [Methylicorpusculum oleiharenae]MCD2451654.1 helix-turn-helix domain-containing protein [Methylicorpusculum oleiharenae]
MSIEFLNAAFRAPLTGASKAVLIALADRCNDAGYCYPALKDIALRAGVSARTATRAVKTLEDSGYLAIIRVMGATNKYILLAGKLTENLYTTLDKSNYPQIDTSSNPLDMMSLGAGHERGEGLDMVSNKPSYNHQLTTKEPLIGKRKSQKRTIEIRKMRGLLRLAK